MLRLLGAGDIAGRIRDVSPQTIAYPSRSAPKTFPPGRFGLTSRFAPLVVSPLVCINSSVLSNLGLKSLHTAKIATYFKGVQVHNV